MYLRSVRKKQASEEGQDEKPNPINPNPMNTRYARKKVTEGAVEPEQPKPNLAPPMPCNTPRADKKLQNTVLQIHSNDILHQENQNRLFLLAQNQQMIKEAIMEQERAEQERDAKLANVAKFEWTAAAFTTSNTHEFYTLTTNDHEEQLGPIPIQYLEPIPQNRPIETDSIPVVAARFEELHLPGKCDP